MKTGRKQGILLFTCCMIAIFLALGAGKKANAKASDYIKNLKEGMNLGDTYETGVEETKIIDTATAKRVVTNIKREGFTTIRIPVTFYNQFDTKTGKVKEEYYKQIQVMVDAAVKAKLKVILTMYGDSWQWLNDASNNKTTKKTYGLLWKQIALHFKNYSGLLSFEGANAPYYDNKSQAEQLTLLNQMNQEFIKAVRGTGGKNKTRTLFISTLNGAVTDEICTSMQKFYIKLKDPNVAVSVHYYGLWSFSVNACGQTTYNNEVKKDISKSVSLLVKKFRAKKIPFVCTEYGLYGTEDENSAVNHGEVLKYYEEFFYQINKNNIPVCLWDTGKLFDRENGRWLDTQFAKLRTISKVVRSSFLNQDSIYLKKGQEEKDVKLTATFHSHEELEEIRISKKALIRGVDYVVDDSKITIKKSFLKKIANANKTKNGTYVMLTVVFTDGVPFQVGIYGYNTKKPQSVAGTTKRFAVPIRFNGDKLVSMEAYDSSNKPSGPLSYSAYQEYGNSFEPDYKAEVIHLKPEFLATLKEGKTSLVFHFASGETIKYTVVRKGDAIWEVNFRAEPVPAKQTAAPATSKPVTASPTEISAVQANAKGVGETRMKLGTEGIISIILALAVVFLLVYSVYFLRKRSMNKRTVVGKDDEKSTSPSIDK